MRRAPLLAAALAALVVLPLPGLAASSLGSYDAARQALLSVWADLPLTVRNVTLTTGTVGGYGDYTARDGSSFAVGEPIHVYAEVLGYGWVDTGDGSFSRQLEADLNLLNPVGNIIQSQAKFYANDTKSREKLLETYLGFEVVLNDFQPGDYTLQFVVHDRAGGKDATVDVPVTLTAADAPASSSSSVAP